MTQKHHSYMRLASQIRTPTSTRIANARPHVNLFESVFSVTVTAPMCAILSKNLLCQFRAAFARNATTVHFFFLVLFVSIFLRPQQKANTSIGYCVSVRVFEFELRSGNNSRSAWHQLEHFVVSIGCSEPARARKQFEAIWFTVWVRIVIM